MDVRSGLLSREEVEAVATNSQNGWTHQPPNDSPLPFVRGDCHYSRAGEGSGPYSRPPPSRPSPLLGLGPADVLPHEPLEQVNTIPPNELHLGGTDHFRLEGKPSGLNELLDLRCQAIRQLDLYGFHGRSPSRVMSDWLHVRGRTAQGPHWIKARSKPVGSALDPQVLHFPTGRAKPEIGSSPAMKIDRSAFESRDGTNWV